MGNTCFGRDERDGGSNTTTDPDEPLDTDLCDLDKSNLLSVKIRRLIEWNTETLLCLLKQILASRSTSKREPRLSSLGKNQSE
jgi:hypothetical protein